MLPQAASVGRLPSRVLTERTLDFESKSSVMTYDAPYAVGSIYIYVSLSPNRHDKYEKGAQKVYPAEHRS